MGSCPNCRKEIPIPLELVQMPVQYALGSREEVNGLLQDLGGRGISNALWNHMKRHDMIRPGVYVGTECIVLNLSEMQMLIATNGCKRELEMREWNEIHENNLWEIVEMG